MWSTIIIKLIYLYLSVITNTLFVFYKNLTSRGLINIKMYYLQNEALLIPIDKLNIPYYFCVNSDLMMTNFFIPQKDMPKLSNIYLNYTTTNFLNK